MKVKSLAQAKVMRWKGEEYAIYTERVVFPDDSEYPVCPLCNDDFGIHRIATSIQAGFWHDVMVSPCLCMSCNQRFAVRRIDPPMDEDDDPDTTIVYHPKDELLVRGFDDFGGGVNIHEE